MKETLEELQKLLEQDTLWEMTAIRKNRTGLLCNICIQLQTDDKKKYKHNVPRSRFQNNISDTVTSENDLIPVSIEDEPRVLTDKPYNKKLFRLVKKWIQLNKENLLKVWNQEMTEFEFMKQMRRLNETK